MLFERILIPIDYGFMAALLEKLKDIDTRDIMPKEEVAEGKEIFVRLEWFSMKNQKKITMKKLELDNAHQE